MRTKTKPVHLTFIEGEKVVSLRDRYWWPGSYLKPSEGELMVTAGTTGTITRTNVLGHDSYEVKFEGAFTALIVGAGTIAPAQNEPAQPREARS